MKQINTHYISNNVTATAIPKSTQQRRTSVAHFDGQFCESRFGEQGGND
jgi:hypothetical protein